MVQSCVRFDSVGISVLALFGATGCSTAPAGTAVDTEGGTESSSVGTTSSAGRTESTDLGTESSATSTETGTEPLCASDEDCDDGVFCNGAERCDAEAGCMAAERESCDDDDTCTNDECDEGTQSCTQTPLDLDSDGDLDAACPGGGDCDDEDDRVSSLLTEVCGDRLDNDCDRSTDEAECLYTHDTCALPLDVTGGGSFSLMTEGASLDYTFECDDSIAVTQDAVATFVLTETSSATISGSGDFSTVLVSLRTDCDEEASSLGCGFGFPGVVSIDSLEPGTYFVLAATVAETAVPIDLNVEFGPPIETPSNDTCSAPLDVSGGATVMGTFAGATDTLDTACSPGVGANDLFYSFTLASESDVTITATHADGSTLAYSVRDTCDEASTQRRCELGAPATGTIHQLAAGAYFVALKESPPPGGDFTLEVSMSAPTPPAAGDTCANPIPIATNGVAVAGTLAGKENDLDVACGIHYHDAVYEFTLPSAADITVELDAGGLGNASMRGTCDDEATELRCTSGDPVFQRAYNVPPGTYSVVVEAGTPVGFNLSVLAEPPTVPTDVSGNDNCSGAFVVPEQGGLFRGDTTTLLPDYSTGPGCGSNAMSNDAAFELTLTSASRVVLSTIASAYDTVVHVHTAACVSGAEVFCNDDESASVDTSFLDVELPAGTHFIIVDGSGGSSVGEYFLDVVVDP